MIDGPEYNITSWPEEFNNNVVDDNEDVISVNVTILLTRVMYLSHLKQEINEQNVTLLAAMRRAAPAILAGLEEGVR